MSLLRLEKVVVDYGSIHALKEIDIDVNTGEVITLIGANGAGKSTTMKAIMGLIPVKSGKIWFDGKEITNLDTKNMVQSGIILSPEGRQVFPRFSVMDNLMMGAYLRPKTEIAESLQTVYDLLPKLKVRSGQLAGSLSGGEQQMLAIGRAMMGKPGCSCSTSLRSVWRRSSSMRSSPWSTGSARWERRSCSWSRTRGSRSSIPTALTYWRPEASY